MNSLCSHEQGMNKESTLQIWSNPCRVEHLLEVMVANKVAKVMAMAEVEGNTTISTIKMEMMTQILQKEEATPINLKTSHTYNVSNTKGMDIISQNVK